MIVTENHGQSVTVTVYGEFTLADYKEFEELVNFKLRFEGPVNLLFDLRQMANFTLDVLWEDLRFARDHVHDFRRIAVVSQSQWVKWSAWLSQVFVDADMQLFEDDTEARQWLSMD